MIVNSAVYVNGHRTEPCSIKESRQMCRERGGFAWIGLFEPDEEEFGSVTREFDLHELAVEDAIKAHQRPKLERYENGLFVVLKSAHYLDATERVEFGEIHIFLGSDFIITVRHGEASSLGNVRQRLEKDPELLRKGPEAVLYAVTDSVVDDYEPVIAGLETDIDEIESMVFGGGPDASQRIYELSREVLEFRRAVQPLARLMDLLVRGYVHEMDAEISKYMGDVYDHAVRTAEQIEAFRELLANILNVNLTLVNVSLTQVGIEQSDQTKKISAWAAILIVPTIITGIYGMNFRYMPELNWLLGYPFALLLMVSISALLYLGFRRSGWL